MPSLTIAREAANWPLVVIISKVLVWVALVLIVEDNFLPEVMAANARELNPTQLWLVAASIFKEFLCLALV